MNISSAVSFHLDYKANYAEQQAAQHKAATKIVIKPDLAEAPKGSVAHIKQINAKTAQQVGTRLNAKA